MWSAIRSRLVVLKPPHTTTLPPQLTQWVINNKDKRRMMSTLAMTPDKDGKTEILSLSEVEKVLSEVKADDVRVIPVSALCDWTDYMVFATGRSSWHVQNIAQALVYKAKQKQPEAPRKLLPSVEGDEGGKWIVVDSGSVVVHALDEQARAYYDLERHWTAKKPAVADSNQDLDRAMVKVRPINNSKRRVRTSN